jgi:hypothetical protein
LAARFDDILQFDIEQDVPAREVAEQLGGRYA